MGNFQGSIACVDIGNCNNKAKFHLGMSLATNIILLVIASSPYTMWPHGPHQSHNVFVFLGLEIVWIVTIFAGTFGKQKRYFAPSSSINA